MDDKIAISCLSMYCSSDDWHKVEIDPPPSLEKPYPDVSIFLPNSSLNLFFFIELFTKSVKLDCTEVGSAVWFGPCKQELLHKSTSYEWFIYLQDLSVLPLSLYTAFIPFFFNLQRLYLASICRPGHKGQNTCTEDYSCLIDAEYLHWRFQTC